MLGRFIMIMAVLIGLIATATAPVIAALLWWHPWR